MSNKSSSRLVRYALLPLRYSLAGRILAGFLVMVGISMVVALAGIFYTSQANSRLVELLEQDRQVTSLVLTMERAAERQNSGVRAFLLNKDDVKVERELTVAISDYNLANNELNTILAPLKLPSEKSENVHDLYSSYSELIHYIRSLNLSEFSRAPTFLWENNGDRSGPGVKEQLIAAIDDLQGVYRNFNQAQVADARNQNVKVTIVALALVTIAGLMGAFVMSLITRSITWPLRKLAGVARAIRQGDLAVVVPLVRGEDEVANLAGAMASMAQNLQASRQEIENSLNESKRRNRELSALNRVAATIGQSLDLNAVLHEALRQLMTVAEAEYGSVFLIEPNGQAMRLVAHENQTEDYIRAYNRILLEDQITGEVARTGEVLMLENPMQDPRVLNPVLQAQVFKRFYLGVPFKSKGQVLGVANLTSQTVRKLEPRDLELLSAIGNQIGVAVDNARLYLQASQVAALEERNRLARDLHDSITQTLFSITLTAESARAMLTRKPEKVEAQVERLQSLARGALAEMRSLIFQLRPVALQEQGLVAALEKHIEALRSKEAFEVDLKIEGARRLSDEHEQTLYRIAQEAFNNIIKHSKASQIWVELQIDDDGARLTIRDNGQGFDARQVMAQRDRSSLGLTSMQERTELSGGTYTIESQPGEGTRLSVYLPLSVAPRPVGIGIKV